MSQANAKTMQFCSNLLSRKCVITLVGGAFSQANVVIVANVSMQPVVLRDRFLRHCLMSFAQAHYNVT